jgi:simple sugar transport system ATP-binding protein
MRRKVTDGMQIPSPADTAPRLLMRHITKTFAGVVANNGVTLAVQAGEVHALLGENGAGKTTLMHILYGLCQPDAGEILVRGQPVRLRSPRAAMALGIGLVAQHFLLVRRHTVAENIALGLPGTRFFLPAHRLEQRLRDLGERYELAIEPRAYIWQLSAGEQQRVEILKALVHQAEILILDEPTSVLTPPEVDALFRVMTRLKAEGQAIIFITHKLGEVLEIADHITVLRQGKVVATLPRTEADQPTLARLMVGREVTLGRPQRQHTPGAPVLTVAQLWATNDRRVPALRDVSFTVHQGEILGVAGAAGNGQRELIEVLTGLRRPTAGMVHLHGREITRYSARALGTVDVAHIPEDRQRLGVVPTMSVAENLLLRHYQRPPFANGPLLNLRAITQFAQDTISAYDMAIPNPSTPVRILSGGTIQRLILARELAGEPGLIVAAHPTYGLDVGATQHTHRLLLQQCERGAAMLLVSADLEEVLWLSDRIMVLCNGAVMGLVAAATTTRQQLGLLMAGVQHV